MSRASSSIDSWYQDRVSFVTGNWFWSTYCYFDYFWIYFMNSFLCRLHNLDCMLTYNLNFHSFQCILSILIHIPCTDPCSSDSSCCLHRCWRQNMLVTNKHLKDVIFNLSPTSEMIIKMTITNITVTVPAVNWIWMIEIFLQFFKFTCTPMIKLHISSCIQSIFVYIHWKHHYSNFMSHRIGSRSTGIWSLPVGPPSGPWLARI